MKKYTVCLALFLMACSSKELTQAKQRCEKFDQIAFINCINSAAQEFEEPDLCNKIRNQGERVQCKRQVAISVCKPELCNTITKSWLIEDCQLRVEEAIQCVVK